MNFVVCVKQVPASMEDIELTEEGEINEEYLTFDINEWDSYALEEAVQLKESYGGKVTVVSVGPEEFVETIRMCLAKGADRAIRIYDEAFEDSDTYSKAKAIADVVKDLSPNLVFTGVQSDDRGHAHLGVALAHLLGMPHASMVTELDYDPQSERAVLKRELEGGLEERMEVKTPAVITIQTGINQPRYASFRKIKEAREKEIDLRTLEDLDLGAEEVGAEGSPTMVERLYEPPVGERAEIFEGSPDETAEQLAEVLSKKGLT